MIERDMGGLDCMTELNGTTAVVTGASRGFGRAIAGALTDAGATVVGVSRTQGLDATDPAVAAATLRDHRPAVLVLNAGAIPAMGPIDELSWADFSRNWEVDTRHVFEWVGAALRLPLEPGTRIIAMSSGAAIHGSPVSGGYAGAKAAVKFISGYAQDESDRRGLGLRCTAILPRLSPTTALGEAGAAAYAARQGIDLPEFLAKLGPPITPESMARQVLDVIRHPAPEPTYEPIP